MCDFSAVVNKASKHIYGACSRWEKARASQEWGSSNKKKKTFEDFINSLVMSSVKLCSLCSLKITCHISSSQAKSSRSMHSVMSETCVLHLHSVGQLSVLQF